MHIDDFVKFHEALCAEARALSIRKGHDYSGRTDTLKNLKLCEAAGICSAEQGALVRMCDKISRMAELVRPGNAARVKDETVRDTVLDLLNYSILFQALREDHA